MDGPIPVVPEVVRLPIGGKEHLLRCAPIVDIGTHHKGRFSDGIERDCVVVCMAAAHDGLGMFSAMSAANARTLAAGLLRAADDCDARNISPVTETVQ